MALYCFFLLIDSFVIIIKSIVRIAYKSVTFSFDDVVKTVPVKWT